MRDAETSDRISSLAGKYGTLFGPDVRRIVEEGREDEFARDIRSMTASLRRQDTTKGLRGLWKRMTGK